MSAKIKLDAKALAMLDKLELIPSAAKLDGAVAGWVAEGKIALADAETSAIAVEALRHHYAKVFETKHGQYKAANGEVLGFDTTPDPNKDSYTWDTIDSTGYYTWIDDDGSIMGEGSMTMSRDIGFMAEAGGKFAHTVFDLERAAADGVNLPATQQRNAKKNCDAKQNWVCLFGDPGKKIVGVFTHPNIQVVLAPISSDVTHGDNRDRLIENKAVDEILADVETIVDRCRRTTLQNYVTKRVLMPDSDISHMKRRRVGESNGTLTVWQLIASLYPEVSFESLNECEEDNRVNPDPHGAASGLRGKCWLALPDMPADECGFVFPRPFTLRAPQLVDLQITVITHAKFGGFKCTVPVAVTRMDFLAKDSATASA